MNKVIIECGCGNKETWPEEEFKRRLADFMSPITKKFSFLPAPQCLSCWRVCSVVIRESQNEVIENPDSE